MINEELKIKVAIADHGMISDEMIDETKPFTKIGELNYFRIADLRFIRHEYFEQGGKIYQKNLSVNIEHSKNFFKDKWVKVIH